jgi:LDH2 family malate/lactate/ureidoglycolate dehydrogenase
MRIDAFRPKEEFKQHMDQWIGRFREATPIEGYERVLIPGDPEREIAVQRHKDGIPLLAPVFEDLKNLAKKFNLDFKG